MNENTQKIIEKQFAALPNVLQQALSDPNLSARCEQIADQAGVPSEIKVGFENEIVMTLMALEPLSTLSERFMNELEIAPEAVKVASEAVRKEIFTQDIASVLEEIYNALGHDTPPKETLSSTDTSQISDEAENARDQPAISEEPAVAETPTPIPSYKKPLTDLPRYDERQADPYKESSGEEGGEDDRGDTRW